MTNYGFKGAYRAAQAGQNRQNAQNQSGMWQQYAPQMSQQRVDQRRFSTQQAMNQMNNQNQTWRFGVNALSGLMR